MTFIQSTLTTRPDQQPTRIPTIPPIARSTPPKYPWSSRVVLVRRFATRLVEKTETHVLVGLLLLLLNRGSGLLCGGSAASGSTTR
jgi:hypothetical protein